MSLQWRGPGIQDFINELTRSSTQTRRESKKVMRERAKEILEESKAGAPIDEGNLEDAHQLAVTRLSKDNIEIEIVVGGYVGGRDVDDYAWVMHEADYNLGPLSLIKNQSSFVFVGPKFLERAVDNNEEAMIEAIADTLPGS